MTILEIRIENEKTRRVIAAIKKARTAAEAAHNAAINLNKLILEYRPAFAPEAALARSSSNLVQHIVQNSAHRLAPTLKIIPLRHARQTSAARS